jgi:hypothetical protein
MSACQVQYKEDARSYFWGIRECLKLVKEQASGWHGVMGSEE